MGIYRCYGCDTMKDDDYSPMAESELCDECDAILEDWTITYNPKPIPLRDDDWDYCHNEYDGPEDTRCGTAGSFQAAVIYIIELEKDL